MAVFELPLLHLLSRWRLSLFENCSAVCGQAVIRTSTLPLQVLLNLAIKRKRFLNTNLILIKQFLNAKFGCTKLSCCILSGKISLHKYKDPAAIKHIERYYPICSFLQSLNCGPKVLVSLFLVCNYVLTKLIQDSILNAKCTCNINMPFCALHR